MKCDTPGKEKEKCDIVVNGKRLEYTIEDPLSQHTIEPSVNLEVINTFTDENMLQSLDSSYVYLRAPKALAKISADVIQDATDSILVLPEQEDDIYNNLSINRGLPVSKNLITRVEKRVDEEKHGEEHEKYDEYEKKELEKFVIEDLPWNMPENLVKNATEDVFQGAYDLTILAVRACDKVPLFMNYISHGSNALDNQNKQHQLVPHS